MGRAYSDDLRERVVVERLTMRAVGDSGHGGQNKLIPGTSRAAQSGPTEL